MQKSRGVKEPSHPFTFFYHSVSTYYVLDSTLGRRVTVGCDSHGPASPGPIFQWALGNCKLIIYDRNTVGGQEPRLERYAWLHLCDI